MIIDHIDGIQVDFSKPPLKNLHALNYLPYGLFNLANTVRMEEKKKTPSDPNVKLFELAHTSFHPIIPSAFHWFSTSLVNFVRLVGLVKLMTREGWTSDDLVGNRDTVNQSCREYTIQVIPEIKKWRDKVSAHFSATAPYLDDNESTLEQSVMNSIAFKTDRFIVNLATLADSQLPTWSITEIFEELTSRYWPDSFLVNEQGTCRPPQPIPLAPER